MQRVAMCVTPAGAAAMMVAATPPAAPPHAEQAQVTAKPV